MKFHTGLSAIVIAACLLFNLTVSGRPIITEANVHHSRIEQKSDASQTPPHDHDDSNSKWTERFQPLKDFVESSPALPQAQRNSASSTQQSQNKNVHNVGPHLVPSAHPHDDDSNAKWTELFKPLKDFVESSPSLPQAQTNSASLTQQTQDEYIHDQGPDSIPSSPARSPQEAPVSPAHAHNLLPKQKRRNQTRDQKNARRRTWDYKRYLEVYQLDLTDQARRASVRKEQNIWWNELKKKDPWLYRRYTALLQRRKIAWSDPQIDLTETQRETLKLGYTRDLMTKRESSIGREERVRRRIRMSGYLRDKDNRRKLEEELNEWKRKLKHNDPVWFQKVEQQLEGLRSANGWDALAPGVTDEEIETLELDEQRIIMEKVGSNPSVWTKKKYYSSARIRGVTKALNQSWNQGDSSQEEFVKAELKAALAVILLSEYPKHAIVKMGSLRLLDEKQKALTTCRTKGEEGRDAFREYIQGLRKEQNEDDVVLIETLLGDSDRKFREDNVISSLVAGVEQKGSNAGDSEPSDVESEISDLPPFPARRKWGRRSRKAPQNPQTGTKRTRLSNSKSQNSPVRGDHQDMTTVGHEGGVQVQEENSHNAQSPSPYSGLGSPSALMNSPPTLPIASSTGTPNDHALASEKQLGTLQPLHHSNLPHLNVANIPAPALLPSPESRLSPSILTPNPRWLHHASKLPPLAIPVTSVNRVPVQRVASGRLHHSDPPHISSGTQSPPKEHLPGDFLGTAGLDEFPTSPRSSSPIPTRQRVSSDVSSPATPSKVTDPLPPLFPELGNGGHD